MRVLLQRVSEAAVRVDGEVIGAVGRGLLALVGITHGDDEAVVDRMAEKVVGLRIFSDAAGKTNLSVTDVGGAVLIVSQFTLYADTRRGRRPGFSAAAEPVRAAALVERFVRAVTGMGISTASGRFGADMAVSLTNDGPVTIWLDSNDWQRSD
jgi:D-tyrosyl-tRNA(Tyr) deacylase